MDRKSLFHRNSYGTVFSGLLADTETEVKNSLVQNKKGCPVETASFWFVVDKG